MLDRYEGGQVTDAAATESSSATESLQPGHGTLMLQSLAVEDVAPSSADISERVDRQSLSALVPAQTAAREAHRLRYLCQLVRRARQPLCPVNGVMTLLDSQLIQANARDIDELQEAIKTDLGTIEYECGLRFPVTALIVGMEKERGFRELIRRVGREQSASQRFGQRFDLRSAANSDVLSAFTSHVCGVFEDWVYTLFRDEATLTRPGNTHLYGLLCKIRFHLNDRLNSILAGGFGHNETQNRDGRAILFSGCYFAATGATQDRQAFVSGAFDKLVEEQEEIEWTSTASRQNRRWQRLAKASWAVCGVLVLCLGAMLVYEFMWRR